MAEVEWDHEQYFRSRVLAHRLGVRLPIWPPPPPKNEIRASFEREMHAAEGQQGVIDPNRNRETSRLPLGDKKFGLEGGAPR